MLVSSRIETPLGDMIAVATDRHLVLLEFADRRMVPTQLARVTKAFKCKPTPGESPVFDQVSAQLDEYFNGRRRRFDVPLQTPGSDFQQRMWRELQRIPAGQTRSYSQMAAALGRPEAVRAVGKANGDNRIAIIIPCHRVIGADGALTGYGGGIWRKQRLLDLESLTALPTPETSRRP